MVESAIDTVGFLLVPSGSADTVQKNVPEVSQPPAPKGFTSDHLIITQDHKSSRRTVPSAVCACQKLRIGNQLAPVRLVLPPFVDNECEREKIKEGEAETPPRPMLDCPV